MYDNEVKVAAKFFMETQDPRLDDFVLRMTGPYRDLMHSQRWAMVYDFFDDVYPAHMDLVTGFTYMIEERIGD